MRSSVLIGLVSCAALTACFDSSPKLSKDDEELFDAVMYAFTGIEDNTKDSYGLMPWQRNARPKVFEYWTVGKNGIGSSNDETNRKIRNSGYVRYVYRLSNPEPCVFRFEEIMEFSKGDSQEDFSVYSMTNMLNSHTFNFANAHTFGFVDNGSGTFIIMLEGPRVVCSEEAGYCENNWTSALSGMAHTRFDDDKEAVHRRGRAIELIKKACPVKAF